MTAVSVNFKVGDGGDMAIDDSKFTFGTSAPGAGDIELRWNLTDTNSNVITRDVLIRALEELTIILASNGRYTTASEQ
jgi:hypothetical protein